MVRVWSAKEIDMNIQTSGVWLARAILALLHRQTLDEQRQERTTVANGMGFNASDARFLMSLGKQIENGYGLSQRQTAVARWMIRKYVGQLTRLANEEGRER